MVKYLAAAVLLVVVVPFLMQVSPSLPWVVSFAQETTSKPNINPAAAEHNNTGVGYMNQYRFGDATAAFQRALETETRFHVARVNLAMAYFYQQEYEKAQKHLQEARKTKLDPYIDYGLGLVLKQTGKNEKAADYFKSVAEMDPADATAFYQLGVVAARLGRNEQAEASLRKCLQLSPQNTSAVYNLATLLMRTQRRDEGQQLLRRFQKLRTADPEGAMSMGQQYGQMGPYGLTRNYRLIVPPSEISSQPPETLAPFRSAQIDTPLREGVELEDIVLPLGMPASDWSVDMLAGPLLAGLGGGVALSDFDRDRDADAVVTRFDRGLNAWRTQILLNDGSGNFEDATAESGIENSGTHLSAAVGDFDNDGWPDLYLVGPGGNRLYRNLSNGRFENVTEQTGTKDNGFPISATFVDYDHDGDLDLYVCHYTDVSAAPAGEEILFPSSFPGEPNRMFRNNGNGSFTERAEELGVTGGVRQSIAMVPSDLDNDRDVDLVVLNEDTTPRVLTNQRSDRFSDISARVLGGVRESYQVLTIADFTRDGFMDLVFSGRNGAALWVNQGDGSFVQDMRSADLKEFSRGTGIAASGVFDADRDGDLDLYLIGKSDTATGGLWENAGDGRFVFAGRFPGAQGIGAASADLTGDGRPDLLHFGPDSGTTLLENQVEGPGHWLGIELEGLRSNKRGWGAKVEVRAGALYQKFELAGHNGYLSQDSPMIWIGLGVADKADTVTVRWPSGILQSEVNVAGDAIVRVKELDRKGTSCPLLYTWNGSAFEFVTDFLGGSSIGYLQAPGQYGFPDTDEYVRIEPHQLVPSDGSYRLNLNNQLEEIIMFDQAQLLLIDHPSETEIYPAERLMPAPPYPEFQIFAIPDARPPVAAYDHHGRDILDLIELKDRRYPDHFRSLPFKGYAETHSVTIDLGELGDLGGLPDAGKLVLLLDAWIDYADSSSNLAASQAGARLIPPYLQTIDADGNWRTVLPSMGFPAGLPKTMTLALARQWFTSDTRIRIVTNMKIYWDRVQVGTSKVGDLRVTRLEPLTADLHFRGYPAYYTPDGRNPWIYDYSRMSHSDLWGTHAGAYTRFGDVVELLESKDDMYVITRHGDEISLEFAAAGPHLKQGWVRDYLLYAVGFGKDMDLNSLYPEVMGPLPFQSMSKFPYPDTEKYPDDEPHRRYRRKYNTRVFPVPQAPAVTN